MEKMPQDWFEMSEIKRRFYDKSAWIPLTQSGKLFREGEYGYLDFKEEYLGVHTLAIPLSQKTEGEKIGWEDLMHLNSKYRSKENYIPGYIYKSGEFELTGEYLVMQGQGNSIECSDWYLNPDLIITLGLKQEGDIWYAIDYGYEEVIKMERNENGCIVTIFIKASYLKDYLSARKMALYMTSYRQRKQILEDADHIKWSDPNIVKENMDRWEGRVILIHEGGNPFGKGFAVLNVSRTDIDFEEDVPNLGFPKDKDTVSESWSGDFKGKKLYVIEGELWRNEWVQPAPQSVVVLDEETEPTSFFITDNSGTKENRKTLDNGSRWLWFKPSVINEILNTRGSSLNWYTRDTGGIGFSSSGVHFGVNQIGLINVYAKDIGLLPDWQQKIWAGHNIAPDGKVSAELLMSQMKAKPASTQSPEECLPKGIQVLSDCLFDTYAIKVFKEHSDIEEILKRTHRFKVMDKNTLFQLAKDIILLTSERIDASLIKSLIKLKEGEKWGQLKSLEKLLALKLDEATAYKLLTPFWGIYTLRGADAHLGSKEIEDAYEACGIDTTKPFTIQGYQLVNCATSSLYRIIEKIKYILL